MATLLLAGCTSSAGGLHTLTSPSLRTWLRDGWAILFSHPDDFVRYDLESDRWMQIARQAFAARGIKPLALAKATGAVPDSWVTQVSGDDRTVLLDDPTQHHFGPVDVQTPALREEIGKSGRFVMVIDNLLRIQKRFAYQALTDLPSPLELLALASSLRGKPAPRIRRPPQGPQAISGLYPCRARSRMIRATHEVPARDLIGTRCNTAAAPATVIGK